MSIDINKQLDVAQSLSSVLDQMNTEKSCGKECQRNRKIAELKTNYDNLLSMTKNKEAERLKDARKQYFTYAFGKQYYDNQERKILEKDVQEQIKKLKAKHDELQMTIREQEKERIDNEVALGRMKQLHGKYVESNDEMLGSMDKQEATVETSHRRVYYTVQKINRINFYRKIITYILRILLAVSIMYFIYKKKYVSLSIIIILYLLIRHFS